MTEKPTDDAEVKSIGEVVDALQERKERATARYQETDGGSFENGKALGRYRAYNELLNFILGLDDE